VGLRSVFQIGGADDAGAVTSAGGAGGVAPTAFGAAGAAASDGIGFGVRVAGGVGVTIDASPGETDAMTADGE
jgi:hypothetical protein